MFSFFSNLQRSKKRNCLLTHVFKGMFSKGAQKKQNKTKKNQFNPVKKHS